MGRIQGARIAGPHGSTAAGQELTKNQKKKQKKGARLLRKLQEGTLLAPQVQRRSPASVKRSRNRLTTFILRNRVRLQKRRNNELTVRLSSVEAEAQDLRVALQAAKTSMGARVDCLW